MTFGSLFSGIGCFDLGLERAGMRCLWQVEADKDALSVLNRHWPDVPKFTDVRKVGGNELATVDGIVFGWPCQDLSVAGRRAGMSGERSGLFFEAARIIGELRPRWFIAENVPGLLSGCGCFACLTVGRLIRIHARIRKRKGGEACAVCLAGKRMLESHSGRNFTAVIRRLEQLGYCVSWRVLDAQYFGVAQRRRRVFFVGSLGDASSVQVLFEPESLSGHPAPSREARQDVAGSIRGGSDKRGWNSDIDQMNFLPVCGTLAANGGGTDRPAGNCNELDFCIPIQYAEQWGRDKRQNGVGLGDEGDPMYTLDASYQHGIARSQTSRNERIDAETENFVITHALRPEGRDASEDGTGRGTPLVFDERQITSKTNRSDPRQSVCPTMHESPMTIAFHENRSASVSEQEGGDAALRAGASHSYQFLNNAVGVRRLTPRECERLQGLPDVRNYVIIKVCNEHYSESLKNSADAGIQSHKSPKHAGSVGRISRKEVALSAASPSPPRSLLDERHAGLNVLIDLEGQRLEMRRADQSLVHASFVDGLGWCRHRKQPDDFVHLGALITSTLAQITINGRAESLTNNEPFSLQPNGSTTVNLCGREIGELVRGAESCINMATVRLKSTTKRVGLSSQNYDLTLRTLCSCVIHAIDGYIPAPIRTANSYTLKLTVVSGWTRWRVDGTEIKDSPRYRMVGNGGCVNVLEWIGKRIVQGVEEE